jgi:hypothetical protein
MKIIYNLSATRRILGLNLNAQVRIEIWDKVVWVHVKGQRPTFLSKKLYHQHFAQYRREGAKAVKIHFVNGFKAQGAKEVYDLDPQDTHIECSCQDYANQRELWGKGCCKHGYALLGMFGYSSLQDYVVSKGG